MLHRNRCCTCIYATHVYMLNIYVLRTSRGHERVQGRGQCTSSNPCASRTDLNSCIALRIIYAFIMWYDRISYHMIWCDMIWISSEIKLCHYASTYCKTASKYLQIRQHMSNGCKKCVNICLNVLNSHQNASKYIFMYQTIVNNKSKCINISSTYGKTCNTYR